MPNEIIDRLRAESNTEDNHMRLLLREAANTLEQMNAKNARLRERESNALGVRTKDSWAPSIICG
jgi:hypothetical protein